MIHSYIVENEFLINENVKDKAKALAIGATALGGAIIGEKGYKTLKDLYPGWKAKKAGLKKEKNNQVKESVEGILSGGKMTAKKLSKLFIGAAGAGALHSVIGDYADKKQKEVAKKLSKKYEIPLVKEDLRGITIRTYILEYDLPEIRFINIEKLDNQELLELFHELEYKYHAIKKLNIPYARKNNQLKIIEEKAREVIEDIAEKYISIFEDWLDKHAILNPRKWAEKRLEEDAKIDDTPETLVENLESEYKRYTGSSIFNYKTFKGIDLKRTFPELYDWLDILVDDLNNTKEEGDVKYDIDSALDFFLESKEDSFTAIANYNINIFNDVVTECYEKLVFPAWYGFWKAEGIDKTRKSIENVFKDLKNIKSKSIENAFMLIDHCSNINHQTGSMKDYLYTLDIDYTALSRLDTKKWDKELKTPVE